MLLEFYDQIKILSPVEEMFFEILSRINPFMRFQFSRDFLKKILDTRINALKLK